MVTRTVTERDVLEALTSAGPLSRRALAILLGVPWMDATLANALADLDRKGIIDLDNNEHPERWFVKERKA